MTVQQPPADESVGDAAEAGTVRLSVVIACRGRAGDHLWEQLQSLASQDYGGDWEVLTAANGMSRGTRAVVDAFSVRLPLRVVDVAERPGKGYAVNATVAQARGSQLVLLDADDVIGSGYLRHIDEALRDNT